MAKTAKKAKKDNKPKPVRTAGRKGKGAEPKDKPKEASGPVGGNINDTELESGIRKLQRFHNDLDKAQKEVNSIRGEIRSVFKGLKAKGVDTDALSFALKQAKLDDQGARFMAWYQQRFAKIMNLPLGTQLDLLNPDKGGVEASSKSDKSAETDEKKVDLSDEVGLVAKANSYEAGNKAGKEAKPRYVPAKWRAYEVDWLRGYDDGQSDNAAKIKGPAAKDDGEGPSFS